MSQDVGNGGRRRQRTARTLRHSPPCAPTDTSCTSIAQRHCRINTCAFLHSPAGGQLHSVFSASISASAVPLLAGLPWRHLFHTHKIDLDAKPTAPLAVCCNPCCEQQRRRVGEQRGRDLMHKWIITKVTVCSRSSLSVYLLRLPSLSSSVPSFR